MEVVSNRQLNRALLQRQMLLQRSEVSPFAAVEHLVGLQAQAPGPPYVALWSRLQSFDPFELSSLLEERKLVRITVMRGTIHLISVADCMYLRPLMQPMIEQALRSSHGKRLGDLDLAEVAQQAGLALSKEPLTSTELGQVLHESWPDIPAADLGVAAKCALPMVQPTPRGLWQQSGKATHVPAEQWLKRKFKAASSPQQMILRYLAAFGPASTQDVQAWCGLTRLAEVINKLKPQLVGYKSEEGKELFDIAGTELPNPDAEAPIRFLGEYDNLTLSHANRDRIIDQTSRKRIATRNGQVPGTILVDGMVSGIWALDRQTKTTTIRIEPFIKLSRAQRQALEPEAMALVEFLTPGLEPKLAFEAPGTLLAGR